MKYINLWIRDFQLTKREDWQSSSTIISCKARQKRTKTSISMLLIANKDIQPSEKHLCLRTAKIQVMIVRLHAFFARAASIPIPILAGMEGQIGLAWPWELAALLLWTNGSHSLWNNKQWAQSMTLLVELATCGYDWSKCVLVRICIHVKQRPKRI